MPEPPVLTFLAKLTVQVGPPIDVGPTPEGHRRIVPILGGTVQGPTLRGRVLPAGADFQVLRTPELTELDARYALETDGGAVIYVHNVALRHGRPEDIARLNRGEHVDPAAIYFRCTPRFSTAASEWSWLNNVLAVGTGTRMPDAVEIDVFTIG